MYGKSAFAFALLPELLGARSVGNAFGRRGVDCSFSVAPNSGDTCETFADTWGVTVDQLKSINPDLDCAKFDDTMEYCAFGDLNNDEPARSTTTSKAVETTTITTSSSAENTQTSKPTSSASDHEPTQPNIAKNCDKFHKVVDGDSCDTIVASAGITKSQFSEWNPYINDKCSNVWLDYYVCIHVPGAITTSAAPKPTDDDKRPTQPGIAKNCDKFHKVVDGDSCDTIVTSAGITKSQFSEWNPYINDKCSNIWLDYYVCIHVPGATATSAAPKPTDDGKRPTQPGIAKHCDKFHKVVSGDQCDSIQSQYEITHKQFSDWNPAINSACTNLQLDYSVCVHIPGATNTHGPTPQMPNLYSDCKQYHRVTDGEGCAQIEKQTGITFAQFRKWNPTIDAKCSNLWKGYYVCTGV